MKLFYYAAAAAAMASAVFCSCDKQDEVTPPSLKSRLYIS